MTLQRHRLVAIFSGLAVLIADFLSKLLVQSSLPKMNGEVLWYPYRGIGVFKDIGGVEFSIVHATNTGAAWSLFQDYQVGLVALRIALIVGLIIYFFLNRNKALEIPLMLVIAGAIGNVIDYFLYDHVIDMFRFVLWGYYYPVFNIADSAILIGIFWMFLASWKKKEPSRPARQKSK